MWALSSQQIGEFDEKSVKKKKSINVKISAIFSINGQNISRSTFNGKYPIELLFDFRWKISYQTLLITKISMKYRRFISTFQSLVVDGSKISLLH